MLYIATVHYETPRWIDIQARYLRENISVPYETWSSLEGIDPSYATRFDRIFEQRGPHAGKLNHLALEICQVASDTDLLMFLDGDAFPISDPMPVVADGLEKAPLVAVQRVENLNEPQPHPCFCVTTVQTWRSLRGDWSLGFPWRAGNGEIISDVGANLLRALELSGTPWHPLLRTNGTNAHPVFFAIYGNVLYHHGAGFRDAFVTRTDRQQLRKRFARQNPAMRWLKRARNRVLGRPWGHETNERIRRQSELIFEAIQRDDTTWLTKLQASTDSASLTE